MGDPSIDNVGFPYTTPEGVKTTAHLRYHAAGYSFLLDQFFYLALFQHRYKFSITIHDTFHIGEENKFLRRERLGDAPCGRIGIDII